MSSGQAADLMKVWTDRGGVAKVKAGVPAQWGKSPHKRYSSTLRTTQRCRRLGTIRRYLNHRRLRFGMPRSRRSHIRMPHSPATCLSQTYLRFCWCSSDSPYNFRNQVTNAVSLGCIGSKIRLAKALLRSCVGGFCTASQAYSNDFSRYLG